MHKLSFIIFVLATVRVFAINSPHGDDFNINCANCHSAESWKELKEDLVFDHDKTGFSLEGQHQSVNCRQCHTTLKFKKESTECMSCHTDMHNNTLGEDCNRCHTPVSWIVKNTNQLHRQSRFPLAGAHQTADCFECHKSASNLIFEPIGTECIDCHNKDYYATTSPNHQQNGYSFNCIECHSTKPISWTGSSINHNFFPLKKSHAINCSECHVNDTYQKISNQCFSCHSNDYSKSTNPAHQQLNFSTNCTDCHTLNPGWEPAKYREHDNIYFPIYSGEHNNEWNSCTDCHSNPQEYSSFTCISCHEHNQQETDKKHSGISGYSYNSNSCFVCHPRGDEAGAFDHNTTGFPLAGEHLSLECVQCHASGFSSNSPECVSCHHENYNQTTNPNHANIGLSTICENCHTANPDWKPASFPVHNNYFALTGAHALISNNCATCHHENYNTTPNTCFACHTNDYNNTTDPGHIAANFPTQCESCHTTNAWKPASFNHDGQYFPIYSGKHRNEWSSCSTCHTNQNNYAAFSCINCHEHSQSNTNGEHDDVSGYTYSATSCYSCHPNGKGD